MTAFTLPAPTKWAFSARRVPRDLAAGLDPNVSNARAGDLILGRVLTVGQHGRIQLAEGRPATLYSGDVIVMPCGARYAPDQFEGLAEIDPEGCDMLAGGGCLGRMVWRHDKMKAPTRVQPLGRLTNAAGHTLTTANFGLPTPTKFAEIPLIVVVGTSMNSGKTTATVALTHGLTRAGFAVAALKGTGTGSFGDVNDYADAGAAFVGDFTDAGMVTTYLEPLERVKAGIDTLLAAAEAQGATVAVMEVADGIFQKETAALLADPGFVARMQGSVFACGDAVAAAGGVSVLAGHGLRPLCLTGLLSCSPMASAEAEAMTGVTVVTRAGLMDPAVASGLLARAQGLAAAA
ncbi:DUF1611 domain-containing protein [Tabrizicola aquatica]|uniref:DUF1611 domain-containing protein n=1 Tax=Tabrizicola aquatica TaxID=909926 RepID=UPI000CD276F5|nr:DUF1611 domain-containing protein [Tabrizicola aquatica]